jgi:hypothetical protein
MGMDGPGGGLNFAVRKGKPEAYVVGHGTGKKKHLLKHREAATAQFREGDVLEGDSVKGDFP